MVSMRVKQDSGGIPPCRLFVRCYRRLPFGVGPVQQTAQWEHGHAFHIDEGDRAAAPTLTRQHDQLTDVALRAGQQQRGLFDCDMLFRPDERELLAQLRRDIISLTRLFYVNVGSFLKDFAGNSSHTFAKQLSEVVIAHIISPAEKNLCLASPRGVETPTVSRQA